MSKGLSLQVGQASSAGRKARNQDFHGACLPEGQEAVTKGMVVALADGVSSSEVSHIASEAAVSGFLADYYSTSAAWTVKQSGYRVLMALNAWLHAQTRQSQYRYYLEKGYLCTFSALVFKGSRAHLFHVGDARVYRYRTGQLECLSREHRLRLSATESYLSRALGMEQSIEIDYQCVDVRRGDVFAIMTDGVHEWLSADQLCAGLDLVREGCDQAAQQLMNQALAQGSDDNLTVQVVQVNACPVQETERVVLALDALEPPPVLAEGAVFDGFQIERQLYFSGRSQVFLVHHDSVPDKRFCLKVPAQSMWEQRDFLERLLREEWIARRVHSPFVLRAGPKRAEQSHVYAVTEYIEGTTLRQWMRDHPRPDLVSVRALVTQMVQGLRALHRQEILHRDLRPENIMVTTAGRVVLIDLGAARVAGLEELSVPSHEDRAGTVQYSAPELFLGHPATPASEQFSLAVIIYEMLCGQLPYVNLAESAVSRAGQRRLRYIPLRHHRPEIAAWMDEVLRKALAPEANDRFEALSEFVESLHAPPATLRAKVAPPLMDRDPVRFWQGVAALQLFLLLLCCLKLFAGDSG